MRTPRARQFSCSLALGLAAIAAGPAHAAEPVRVDVLVVYTPAARDEVGGATAMASFIATGIKDTNDALARSDVPVVINLLDIREVAYTEDAPLLNFQRFHTAGDGHMEEVFQWRNELGADLMGIILKAGGNAAIVPPPGGSQALGFFSVNTSGRFGYNRPNFPHEVAHTLGAGHHWQSAAIGGTFPYSRDQVSAGQYYNYAEVMVSGGPPPAEIIGPVHAMSMRFANPRLFHDGVATGRPEGQTLPADNARTMRELAALIAAYRNETTTLAGVAPQVALEEPAVFLRAPGYGATFTARVSGRPYPDLQWQQSVDGVTWIDVLDGVGVSGSTTANLSIANVPASMDGWRFRVRASSGPNTVISSPATLTLNVVRGATQQDATEFASLSGGGWQDFVPRVDHIDAIDVFVRVSGSPGPVTATLELAGSIVATQVFEISWPTVELSEWVRLPFAVTVDPAQTYRLRLTAPPGPPANEIRWRGTLTNAYPEGRSDFSPASDMAFRVLGRVFTEPPSAPFNLQVASIVGNLVTFTWTPGSSGSPATGFVVEGGGVPGQPLISLPTGSAAPRFQVTAPSGSFFVRVRAARGSLRSAPSEEIAVHVNVPVTPSPPRNLLATVDQSTVVLAWRNTFEGGTPAIATLQVSGGAVAAIPLGSVDRASFGGVPAGTYTLAVTSSNSAGASDPSNSVVVTVPAPCSGVPQTPTDFLAYRAGRTIFVEWQLPATGAAPSDYVLNVTGAVTATLPLPGRSISGAVGPGTYHLSVAARNGCGTSPSTAPQTVVVP